MDCIPYLLYPERINRHQRRRGEGLVFVASPVAKKNCGKIIYSHFNTIRCLSGFNHLGPEGLSKGKLKDDALKPTDANFLGPHTDILANFDRTSENTGILKERGKNARSGSSYGRARVFL